MPTEAMTMPKRPQSHALWAALGVVLLICAWFASHDDDAADAVARPLTHASNAATRPARSAPAAQEKLLLATLTRALATSATPTAFPVLTDAGRNAWAAPAATPPAAASSGGMAAATAEPPAFPFQWVGVATLPDARKAGATRQVAIIAGANSTRMVGQGDVFDEDWKIESLSAERLQVIHLPSSSRQTITMSKQ